MSIPSSRASSTRTWDDIALDGAHPDAVAKRGRSYLDAAKADQEPNGVSIKKVDRKGDQVFGLRGTDKRVDGSVIIHRTVHAKANRDGYRYTETRVAADGDGRRQRTVVTVQTKGTGTVLKSTIKSPTEGSALLGAVRTGFFRESDASTILCAIAGGVFGFALPMLALSLKNPEISQSVGENPNGWMAAGAGATAAAAVLVQRLVAGLLKGRAQARARVERIESQSSGTVPQSPLIHQALLIAAQRAGGEAETAHPIPATIG